VRDTLATGANGFMKLTLPQKAMILVAVPLVFELAFLVGLGVVLDQAERERVREAHARDVSAHLSALLRLLLERETAVVVRHLSENNPNFKVGFQEFSRRILVEYDILKEITRDNDRERAQMEDFEKLRTKLDEHFLRANYLMDHDEKVAALKEWLLLQKYIGEIHNTVARLVEEQETIQQQRRVVLSQYRSQINAILVTGFLVNIFLAVGLASYFNRGTTRRLNVLMDNTYRLAVGVPLHKPLSGEDEIGRLDSTFHQMADDLHDAEQQRAHIEQLKQEFVQMVSHDLRAPVTSLQLFHSILAKGDFGQLDEDGKRHLAAAEENTERMFTLVSDLLEMEKLESGTVTLDRRPIDVDSVLDAAVIAVQGLAKKRGVEVNIMGHDNPKIYADRERLIQVAVNMITNAIKFSPDNGSVLISVKELPTQIEIRVSDEGAGIAPDLQKEIFERFKQSGSKEQQSKGAGLGLAIARSLVELHEGRIGVESEVGEGSTFWFRVPRAAESSVAESPEVGRPVV
jgi:signal transduction histidine kinase